MEIKQGYTLSQFVDFIGNKKESEIDTYKALKLILYYNELLKQPLKEEMFVNEVKFEECNLCGGTGSYHYGGSFGGSVQEAKCDCVEIRKAILQEAEKKVIFENVESFRGIQAIITTGKNRAFKSFVITEYETLGDLFQATNGQLKTKNLEI